MIGAGSGRRNAHCGSNPLSFYRKRRRRLPSGHQLHNITNKYTKHLPLAGQWSRARSMFTAWRLCPVCQGRSLDFVLTLVFPTSLDPSTLSPSASDFRSRDFFPRPHDQAGTSRMRTRAAITASSPPIPRNDVHSSRPWLGPLQSGSQMRSRRPVFRRNACQVSQVMECCQVCRIYAHRTSSFLIAVRPSGVKPSHGRALTGSGVIALRRSALSFKSC